MTSFSVYLWLVYRKAIDLYKLILYPSSLLNLFIISSGFLVEFLVFLIQYYAVCKEECIRHFFFNFGSLIFFSCLTAAANTSSIVLRKSGASSYLSVIPACSGVTSNLSPLRTLLAVGFLFTALLVGVTIAMMKCHGQIADWGEEQNGETS